jgi:putative ABC transport system permease protein
MAGIVRGTLQDRRYAHRQLRLGMALGAQRRDVLELMVFHGMLPALAGVAVGVAGALALTRLMASLRYGTRPSDAMTLVGGC